MKVEKMNPSDGDVESIRHEVWGSRSGRADKLISCSRRLDPGYLWIGVDYHLNRDQVIELIGHLQSWVDTGSLTVSDAGAETAGA